MEVPPVLRKTIQAIDRKIQALEDMKKSLLETFGSPAPTAKTNGNKPIPATTVGGTNSRTKTTSGMKLEKFIKENGPVTRKQIVQQSGVPDGSISYLLKHGNFRQREDEKWEAVDK